MTPTTVTDPNSNDWKHAYDAQGRVSSITDPALKATIYTWDSNRNLTGVTDRNTNSTTMTYDANGNMLTRTDALSNADTLTYDATFSRVLTYTDRKSSVWTNTYDANGNRTQSQDPLTNISSWAYNAAGQVTSATDPKSNVTVFTYDANGNLATVTDPLTNQTQFTYDSASRLTQVTDPNTNVTSYAYDSMDRMTASTDALTNADAFTYDANGNLTAYTNRRGNAWTTTYDPLDRVTAVTDPLTNADSRAYDANGNLTTYTDRLGNAWTTTYNALNRVTVVTDPLTNTDIHAYDANGNQTSFTDRNGNATTYAYDALNRVTAVTDALTNADSRAYDANGNQTSYTDRNGNTTAYAYDALNRVTAVTDALTNADALTYDANGNLTTYTDRRGNAWTATYDGLDRVTSRTNPLSAVWSYSYDANGNLTGHTDAKSQVTTSTYDGLDRLVGQTFDGASTATFTYDAGGNQLTAVDANSSYTYVYDSLDRRTMLTDNSLTKSVLYAHDAVGQLTSKTGPEGDVVTYVYNAASRLTSLTEGAGTTTFTYDAVGNLTKDTPPSGTFGSVEANYTYDANNRLTWVDTESPLAGPVQWFVYTRDANGWVTATSRFVTDSDGLTFTRDALGRITQETGGTSGNSSDYVRDYTYDANGNQTGLTSTLASGTPSVATLAIDAANRPTGRTTSSGTTTYAYDANGSRLTTTWPGPFVQTWGYDDRNRVVSFAAGGSTVDYTYDVMDRMVRRQDSSGADRRTMYGSDTPVAVDRDGNGSLDTKYTGLPLYHRMFQDPMYIDKNKPYAKVFHGSIEEAIEAGFFGNATAGELTYYDAYTAGLSTDPPNINWSEDGFEGYPVVYRMFGDTSLPTPIESVIPHLAGGSLWGDAGEEEGYNQPVWGYSGDDGYSRPGVIQPFEGPPVGVRAAATLYGHSLAGFFFPERNHTPIESVLPELAASSNWQGDIDQGLGEVPLIMGGRVHSVTQDATVMQLLPGGNLDPSRNTIAFDSEGEVKWRGTAYSDGKIRTSSNLGFSASSSVGFEFDGQLFGAIEESSYSMTIGPPGTATIYDANTRSNLTVGGSVGNSAASRTAEEWKSLVADSRLHEAGWRKQYLSPPTRTDPPLTVWELWWGFFAGQAGTRSR